MLLAALALLLGIDLGVLGTIVAPALGVLGVGATGVLLVTDLKRPERFLYILLKSNFKSWLVLGSYALGRVRRRLRGLAAARHRCGDRAARPRPTPRSPCWRCSESRPG